MYRGRSSAFRHSVAAPVPESVRCLRAFGGGRHVEFCIDRKRPMQWGRLFRALDDDWADQGSRRERIRARRPWPWTDCLLRTGVANTYAELTEKIYLGKQTGGQIYQQGWAERFNLDLSRCRLRACCVTSEAEQAVGPRLLRGRV